MVDGTSYNRMCADFAWDAPKDEALASAMVRAEATLSADDFAEFKARQAEEQEVRGLSDEQRLIATNVIRGFSFAEKKWFLLFIEHFSEVTWNEVRFPSLLRACLNGGYYRNRLIDLSSQTRPRRLSARW
jgi:hypothetical protein